MKILDAAKAATSAAVHAVKSVFTTTTLTLSSWYAAIAAAWGGVSYEALARRAYRNPTCARGLRLVAQLMAGTPFVVEVDGGEMVTDPHDPRAEMLRLLDRPNPRTNRTFLFDQIVAHLYCAGEVFVRRVAPTSGPNAGRPTANGGSLSLVNPGGFREFVREAGGEITGYVFESGGRAVRYDTDEMLHIRIYNPTDEERGMPLLLAAARALDQVEAADGWNKSVASGGGRIPGRLYPNLDAGQQLTPEQVAHAQSVADAETMERRAKFLPKVMSGSFRYEAEGMTLRDADFLKAGEANARRIAAVVGVTYELIGAESSGSLTDAGVDSHIRAVYLLTVLPLLDFVLGELNVWLSPAYGGARLAYDRDQIEALNEDVNNMFDRYVKATGGPFLTVDEAREANGYEPLGGESAGVRRGAVSNTGTRDGDRDGAAGEGDPVLPVRSVSVGPELTLVGVRETLKRRYEDAA